MVTLSNALVLFVLLPLRTVKESEVPQLYWLRSLKRIIIVAFTNEEVSIFCINIQVKLVHNVLFDTNFQMIKKGIKAITIQKC